MKEKLYFLFCQVYLNWANSVLSDLGELPCEGVSSVQEGRVLCQLIDKLCTGAGLTNKVEVGVSTTEQHKIYFELAT